MVRVCDAIMGTGKSSAAISYINEHPEKRFIYVTPYIEEANRIKEACKDVDIYEPKAFRKNTRTKTQHTMELIREGKSVATTHRAFYFYTEEMRNMIREKGYTLIIDENVSVLEQLEISGGDVKLAADAKCIVMSEDGTYELGDNQYEGSMLYSMFATMNSRKITEVNVLGSGRNFYWQLPPDLIQAFEDVFVLTYMFNGQSLRYLFDMNGIEYTKIGVTKDESGVFRFSDTDYYIPDYVYSIRDKIHLITNHKINRVGDSKTALSMNWFARKPDEVKQLKNNIYNLFNNITKASYEDRLWGTYSKSYAKIYGSGYKNRFLAFNARATNKYRNCTVLAYCSNVYMNVGHKWFYKEHGVQVDEDMFALSTLVQWVWRSAIRDGGEITLYIPSSRMRNLFINWMDSLSKGEVYGA